MECDLQIQFKTTTDISPKFQIPYNWTVKQTKEFYVRTISPHYNLLPLFIYRGTAMKDDRTISSYFVEPYYIIHIIECAIGD